MALFGALLPAAGAAGQQWSDAAVIDNTADGFGSSTGQHDVATGANGLATVLFFQVSPTSGSLGAPYAVRRAAGATTWTSPHEVPLPRGRRNAPAPSLAATTAGDAIGTFAFDDGIFAARWPASDAAPGQSSKQLCVQAGTEQICAAGVPATAADGNGRGYLVAGTSTSTDGKIIFTSAEVGSGAFAPATEIAQGRRPTISANDRGDVAVSYLRTVSDETRLFVRRRKAGETSFSPEHQLSLNGGGDVSAAHDVAIDDQGTITAVRAEDVQADGLANDIYATRWLPGKALPETGEQISNPFAIAPPAGAPKVAAGPGGTATAVWTDGPGSGKTVNSAEFVNGRWSAPVALSGGSVPEGAFDIAVDAESTATLVYVEGVQIRARRRGTGRSWTAPVNIGASNAGDVAPASARVSARAARQADAVFVQNTNTRAVLLAARFTAPAEAPPPGTPVVDAETCPVGFNKISGGEGNDRLGGTNSSDAIFGRGGNDQMGGAGGDDCIRSGTGDDDAGGDAGNDELSGDDGNDTLRGDQGGDALIGNDDNDVLASGDGRDRVVGGGGDDRLSGGRDGDELDAGSGDDRVFAGSGDDFAAGGDGNDLMNGGAGIESMLGQGGDDRMSASSGNRSDLRGGDGNDRLRGGRGRDFLVGDAGRDRLFGLSGRDLLIGGEGLDVLKGNAGNDRLYGREGDDRMRGGSGADLLKGGTGDDKLWGDSGRDTIRGSSGRDLIHAADGRQDAINCGRDRDRVIADSFDRVSRNCERVRTKRARSR